MVKELMKCNQNTRSSSILAPILVSLGSGHGVY